MCHNHYRVTNTAQIPVQIPDLNCATLASNQKTGDTDGHKSKNQGWGRSGVHWQEGGIADGAVEVGVELHLGERDAPLSHLLLRRHLPLHVCVHGGCSLLRCVEHLWLPLFVTLLKSWRMGRITGREAALYNILQFRVRGIQLFRGLLLRHGCK